MVFPGEESLGEGRPGQQSQSIGLGHGYQLPLDTAVQEVMRDRPRRAGELSKHLGLSPPAMSRHLKALKSGGLVEEHHPEIDARVRIFSLKPEPMADLKAWLEETEKLWVRQLAAFRSRVERGQ